VDLFTSYKQFYSPTYRIAYETKIQPETLLY